MVSQKHSLAVATKGRLMHVLLLRKIFELVRNFEGRLKNKRAIAQCFL